MLLGGSRSDLPAKGFYPLTFQRAVGCVRHRTRATEPQCFCPPICSGHECVTSAPLPRTKILLPTFAKGSRNNNMYESAEEMP
jgi:hypothetical protein